jgi:hypothetical protein
MLLDMETMFCSPALEKHEKPSPTFLDWVPTDVRWCEGSEVEGRWQKPQGYNHTWQTYKCANHLLPARSIRRIPAMVPNAFTPATSTKSNKTDSCEAHTTSSTIEGL